MSPTPAVLWHFRFSHFNEKVRWALDWKRLPHQRRAVVPGFHMPEITALSGQRAVPVLQLGDRVLTDSTAIIAALEAAAPEPALYPRDAADRTQALALEDWLDEELGPDVRRLVFHAILPDDDYCVRLMAEAADDAGRRRFAEMFPMIREVMRSEMDVDDAHAAESHARLSAALDRLAVERGGRDYLVGDAFTVADLTAAALLSPLLLPPQFPYRSPAERPAALEMLRAAFASHPTFAWAMALYGRDRGTSAETPAP